MAKIPGLVLKESEVSQTIDLKELFGVPLTGSEGLKQAIGQAIIDKILKRTENNLDVNGSKFKPYSKEYVDSLDFKAFGKTKGDINMTLSGGMLGTLDILSSEGSKITIGWDDTTENAKAYNHNKGDTLPKRQFFGITDKELKEIKSQFEDRVKKTPGSLQEEKDSIRAKIIEALSRQFRVNPEVDNG